MPLFRRKSEKLPKTSSLSLYGQGRSQNSPSHIKKDPSSDRKAGFLDENQPPFLTFAEATYDPSLPVRSKSRLSKTLENVLRDNGALAYFIQFMEAKKAKHLVKFWLEAESYHVSVTSRLRDLSSSDMATSRRDSSFYSLDSQLSDIGNADTMSNNLNGSSQVDNDNPAAKVTATSGGGNSYFQSNSSKETAADAPSNPTCRNQTSPDECSIIQSSCEAIKLDGDCDIQYELARNNQDGGFKSPREMSVNILETHPIAISVNSDGFSDLSDDPVAELAEEASKLNLGCHKENLGFMRLQTSIDQDAKAIYNKYIARGCESPIGISEELYNCITDAIFRPDNSVEPDCFFPAQQFIVKKMDEEYFPLFLRSSFHCKHQIDVLTSGTVYLADVLYNDSALFYFMEFMEQEKVRHLLDFLLMADNFEKHLNSLESYDKDQAQNDAMVIYDKYFSLQATSFLGFSDSIRFEVEQNICREDGPLPDCFKKPVMILSQYIEKTYLLQFLNSQLYFKYISECIITIQSGGETEPENQKNSAGSESGSEHSLPLSSMNTLLVMDGKQPGASSKVLKNIEDQDMRIDTGRFKPDSLWQRPLAGKLQIAGVDRLGRVYTEFEPDPDRRRESRIAKAMKKLVNREYDKSQEEMAWKVAEMIVNDICSITMPPGSTLNPKTNGPS